jgi:hypothetical protein
VEALRKKERQGETQETVKMDGFMSFTPLDFTDLSIGLHLLSCFQHFPIHARFFLPACEVIMLQ